MDIKQTADIISHVSLSTTDGGYKSEEMNGHHSADSPSPTDEELQKHNDKILEELDLNLHRIDKVIPTMCRQLRI